MRDETDETFERVYARRMRAEKWRSRAQALLGVLLIGGGVALFIRMLYRSVP